MNFPVLLTLICLPLFGVFVVALVSAEDEYLRKNTENVSLLISTVCLLLSMYTLYFFEYRFAGIQFEEIYGWVSHADTSIHFGIDGISICFLFLSNFLTVTCLLASFNKIKTRVKLYYMSFLFLQSMLNGFFVSQNILIFYIFFEAVLIPLFLIISIWGGADKTQASFKMLLYTIFGSLFFLVVIIRIYVETGETDMLALQFYDWPAKTEKFLFWGAFLAFAIKLPMFPVHTWLPLAHTQAPTAGSMMLAGILLKMGGYGMLRVCLSIFPHASIEYAPIISALSVFAILYGALVAMVQTDIKKLVAYSSISHMGFVTLGIFTLNVKGISGAVFQMISHGLISSALFMCVGILYDKFKTRYIYDYGGLKKEMPKFSFLFFLFILASLGMPGTMGFIGEISVIVASFEVNLLYAFLGSLGVIFSAVYGLWLYKNIFHGESSTKINWPTNQRQEVLSIYEWLTLVMFAASIVFFGIYSKALTNFIVPSGQKIASILKNAPVDHQ